MSKVYRLDKPRFCPVCRRPLTKLLEVIRCFAEYAIEDEEEGTWGPEGEIGGRESTGEIFGDCSRSDNGCGHIWMLRGVSNILEVIVEVGAQMRPSSDL